jgi:hypothetical protein
MPMPFTRRFRRNRTLKVARMLVALDRAAAEVRPVPVRKTRISTAK